MFSPVETRFIASLIVMSLRLDAKHVPDAINRVSTGRDSGAVPNVLVGISGLLSVSLSILLIRKVNGSEPLSGLPRNSLTF